MILQEVKEDYFEAYNSKLRELSNHAYEKLSGIKGIEPMKASAALYMMVRINFNEFKDINDDVDFCKKLVEE